MASSAGQRQHFGCTEKEKFLEIKNHLKKLQESSKTSSSDIILNLNTAQICVNSTVIAAFSQFWRSLLNGNNEGTRMVYNIPVDLQSPAEYLIALKSLLYCGRAQVSNISIENLMSVFGALHLECEEFVLIDDNNASKSLVLEDHCEQLMKGLQQLCSKQACSDLSILVEGHLIRVHRLVVSAYSSVLDETLAEDDKARLVHLPGISLQSAQAIIAYMYYGRASIAKSLMEEFHKLSSSLKMAELATVTQKKKNGISVEEQKDCMTTRNFIVQTESVITEALKKLRMLYDVVGRTDLTLLVEGKRVHTHKSLLGVSCPSIHSMLMVEPVDEHSIILLVDIDYSSIASMLGLIYSGTCFMSMEQIRIVKSFLDEDLFSLCLRSADAVICKQEPVSFESVSFESSDGMEKASPSPKKSITFMKSSKFKPIPIKKEPIDGIANVTDATTPGSLKPIYNNQPSQNSASHLSHRKNGNTAVKVEKEIFVDTGTNSKYGGSELSYSPAATMPIIDLAVKDDGKSDLAAKDDGKSDLAVKDDGKSDLEGLPKRRNRGTRRIYDTNEWITDDTKSLEILNPCKKMKESKVKETPKESKVKETPKESKVKESPKESPRFSCTDHCDRTFSRMGDLKRHINCYRRKSKQFEAIKEFPKINDQPLKSEGGKSKQFEAVKVLPKINDQPLKSEGKSKQFEVVNVFPKINDQPLKSEVGNDMLLNPQGGSEIPTKINDEELKLKEGSKIIPNLNHKQLELNENTSKPNPHKKPNKSVSDKCGHLVKTDTSKEKENCLSGSRHDDDRAFIKDCNVCDREFHSQNEYIDHIKEHEMEFQHNTFECQKCNTSLLHFDELQKHVCFKETEKHLSLEADWEDSPSDELFSCNKCKFSCTNFSDLMKHVDESHKNKRKKMKFVEKPKLDYGGNRSALSSPLPDSIQWPCSHCSFKCSNYEDMVQHAKNSHSIDNKGVSANSQNSLSAKNPTPSSNDNVEDVAVSTDNPPPSSNDNAEDTENSSNSFACPECGKYFDNLESFSAHAEEEGHGGLVGSCWICGVCKNAFFEEKELNEHLASHNPPLQEEEFLSTDVPMQDAVVMDDATHKSTMEKTEKGQSDVRCNVEADSSVLDGENTFDKKQGNKTNSSTDSGSNIVTSSVNLESSSPKRSLSPISIVHDQLSKLFGDLY